MKKILIGGILSVFVLGGAAGAGYYFLVLKKKDAHEIIVVDSAHLPEVPAPAALTGKVFIVPGIGATTTANALFPTSRRDYPMGRYTSADGKVTGSLVVLDEFVTVKDNNRLVVPFMLQTGGSDEPYYLAILEGDDLHHATSAPIGDHIKITGVTQRGDQATVSYLVHDRDQVLTDVPTIGTSAVINIATGAVVQAGRTPASEIISSQIFADKYYWSKTTYADGKVTKPDDLEHFALAISGAQLTLETDCNTGGASFTFDTVKQFKVGSIDATKKTCGSQYEGEYFAIFGKVSTYAIAPSGALTLYFDDAGKMEFLAPANKAPTAATATSTASSSTSN